ncbi:hypothetical protein MUJ63_00140 [Lachnospiraceae bacterium NSJ-143]|nr:hypothetical protein [Lachnospiraceae bacterium NSJ-143]
MKRKKKIIIFSLAVVISSIGLVATRIDYHSLYLRCPVSAYGNVLENGVFEPDRGGYLIKLPSDKYLQTENSTDYFTVFTNKDRRENSSVVILHRLNDRTLYEHVPKTVKDVEDMVGPDFTVTDFKYTLNGQTKICSYTVVSDSGFIVKSLSFSNPYETYTAGGYSNSDLAYYVEGSVSSFMPFMK